MCLTTSEWADFNWEPLVCETPIWQETRLPQSVFDFLSVCGDVHGCAWRLSDVVLCVLFAFSSRCCHHVARVWLLQGVKCVKPHCSSGRFGVCTHCLSVELTTEANAAFLHYSLDCFGSSLFPDECYFWFYYMCSISAVSSWLTSQFSQWWISLLHIEKQEKGACAFLYPAEGNSRLLLLPQGASTGNKMST